MKKSKTVEWTICDYHLAEDGSEVDAVGKTMPSGKDACEQHLKAYTKEVRLPDEFGNEMSSKFVAVDPTYDAKMVIEYKKEKPVKNVKEVK